MTKYICNFIFLCINYNKKISILIIIYRHLYHKNKRKIINYHKLIFFPKQYFNLAWTDYKYYWNLICNSDFNFIIFLNLSCHCHLLLILFFLPLPILLIYLLSIKNRNKIYPLPQHKTWDKHHESSLVWFNFHTSHHTWCCCNTLYHISHARVMELYWEVAIILWNIQNKENIIYDPLKVYTFLLHNGL